MNIAVVSRKVGTGKNHLNRRNGAGVVMDIPVAADTMPQILRSSADKGAPCRGKRRKPRATDIRTMWEQVESVLENAS